SAPPVAPETSLPPWSPPLPVSHLWTRVTVSPERLVAHRLAICTPARSRLCRMAADIVPIRLGLTKGDLYTLWAPRWRDAGDEWEALLGKDEDLYGFESVADLVAFIRTNS